MFAHPLYLQRIWVKFACHQVEVLIHGWSFLKLEGVLVYIYIVLVNVSSLTLNNWELCYDSAITVKN